jgi:hypothetical protein
MPFDHNDVPADAVMHKRAAYSNRQLVNAEQFPIVILPASG